MPHILFLADCIATQQAGIHVYARNLVYRFLKEFPRYTFTLITPRPLPEFTASQIVVPLKDKIPFHLRYRQLFVIPRIVNRLAPDLVVELAHFGPFFLKPDIKRITVIHDLTPLTNPKWHPVLSVIFHRLILKRITTRADYIITNSSRTKSDLLQRYRLSGSKIIISNPCLYDLPVPDSGTVAGLTSRKYFLTVGTMEPRKNHSTIIKAFDQFCLRRNDYQLVIAGGKGWNNRKFYRILEASPNRDKIQLTGFVSRSQLLSLYHHAKAFVFASFYEGFGIPILEASYYSLPLVLANNESIPPWFRESALLFDPQDHVLLCDHLLTLVGDQQFWDMWSKKSQEANHNYLAEPSDLEKIVQGILR